MTDRYKVTATYHDGSTSEAYLTAEPSTVDEVAEDIVSAVVDAGDGGYLQLVDEKEKNIHVIKLDSIKSLDFRSVE